MKYLKIIGTVVVVLLAAFGVYSLFSSPALAGAVPQVSSIQYSHFTGTIYAGGDIVEGGGTYATSSANGGPGTANDGLVEAEMLPNNLIQYTPTNASTTIYLPLFVQVLTNIGDEESTYIQNATTTGGVNLIVTGIGSGTTLTLVGSTTATVPAGYTRKLECMRLTMATSTCFLY